MISDLLEMIEILAQNANLPADKHDHLMKRISIMRQGIKESVKELTELGERCNDLAKKL